MDLAQKRAFLAKLSASEKGVHLPSAPPWHEHALGRIPEPAKRKTASTRPPGRV